MTSPPDRERTRLRTLVLGGTRSGKSAWAESAVTSYAASSTCDVRYIATGRRDPDDADWEERIDGHRRRRPASWRTAESAAGLSGLLEDHAEVTLVDDLGTWLTGVIDDRDAWDLPRGTTAPDSDSLVDAVAAYSGILVLVSPEVGWGVVPPTRSGRLFQDEMGSLNGRLAAMCDHVVLVVAGLPLTLKDTRDSGDREQFHAMKGRQ